MPTLTTYKNGLRLITDTVPGLKSVAAGIWVNMGSSKETAASNGLSHFTEHVLFKGTDKLSAFDIADRFESFGALVNAFTGKECTCYYVKSIDEHTEACFELLSHLFFDSVFDNRELDKERNVILEEMHMVEDTPEDICYDLLAEALYGKSPLGQTILGLPKNVKKFNQASVKIFVNSFYCAENSVISFAGNITPDEADVLVRRHVLPKICAQASNLPGVQKLPKTRCHRQRIKDFEQSNIGLGFYSLPFNDPRAAAQNVLNVILGGSMSSRLFQAIREQLGLAYSVYSAPSAFLHNGSFNIAINVSPENTQKTLDAVLCEIRKVLSGDITQNELARAKTQLKSSLVFARENVQSVMSANGKLLTVAGEVYNLGSKIAEIDAVDVTSINLLASEIFRSQNLCSSYVGKKHGADFGELHI
ncbi:MAG: insulinase family protein [Firmicutes bacterium]|nr:insulinase family protein [Bacillota bacterium]